MKFARRILDIEESKTLAATEKAGQLRAKGIDIVSLTAGEPDFDTPQNIKDAAVVALSKGYTKYTPASGIPDLKRAIASKLERENGLKYDPSQIVVSCGCKHAIYNTLMVLLESGDECLIPAPYWTSYPDMVSLTGARPVTIRTEESAGFKLTPDVLRRAITPKSRMLILCNPSNPTGIVYTRDELATLAQVIVEGGIFVLADEVYEKLIYDGARSVSIASFGEKINEQTLLVNGVSKTYAMTGWRIGYLAASKEIALAAGRFQSQVTSNPTSVAQHAAIEALNGEQASVARMLEEYQRRRDYVYQRLVKMPGIRCIKPGGAFYVFPNVSRAYGKKYRGQPVSDSLTLANLLLEQAHVAVVAGEAFGSDHHLRLSYATSKENLQKALDRIEAFLAELR